MIAEVERALLSEPALSHRVFCLLIGEIVAMATTEGYGAEVQALRPRSVPKAG